MDMKKVGLLLLAAIFSTGIYAQEIQKVAKAKAETLSGAPADTAKKRWFIQGSMGLNFTQAAFSNWASGGQNSLGLSAMVNLKINYKKNRHAWSNTIDLGYGFQILGKASEAKFSKINDKIELTTAYGFELDQKKHWYLTVLANFRTQFDKGYNYPNDSVVLSKFMAPGYLIAGIGINYTPANWFYVYLSPVSGRFTFVLDTALSNQGAFGVDKGKEFRGEFGPYLRADLNKDLVKNINLSTTLELFTDYLHKFGNIDVNWNFLLTMKVNKWLAASIQMQLIYDDDVMIQSSPDEMPGPRTQFKEMLGIGLSYKIN